VDLDRPNFPEARVATEIPKILAWVGARKGRKGEIPAIPGTFGRGARPIHHRFHEVTKEEQ
jgi:hypothetical protein